MVEQGTAVGVADPVTIVNPAVEASRSSGVDLHLPIEAVFLSPSELEWTAPEDYHEEVVTTLSSARSLAVEAIEGTQKTYKASYDRKTEPKRFKIGQEVLVRFPQEEQGRLRKLSQPWHGLYRIVSRDDPDLTVAKVTLFRSTRPECASVQLDSRQDTTGMARNAIQVVHYRGGYITSWKRCSRTPRLQVMRICLSDKNRIPRDTIYVHAPSQMKTTSSGRAFVKGRSDVIQLDNYVIVLLLLLGL